MNWMLILVIALWAFYIVRGYKKGMLRMLYSLVSWIVILVISVWATPYVSDFLTENTAIESKIYEKSYEKLHEMVNGSAQNKPNNENSDKKSNKNSINQEILAVLGIEIPEELADAVMGDTNIADSVLETTGLYEQISKQITEWAMRGISFIICILIAVIASHILYSMIKIVEDVPVIGTLNRILGIIVASIKCLFVVWTCFAIIAMNGATETGIILTSYIYESEFLIFLYENNLILNILFSIL
ncbi:MAG: CvpA family protein [Agathobacter sp.]|nr:CvpA family protein [Agathobacter sp.]